MSNNLDQLTSIIHALIGMEFEQTIRPDEWPDELRPTVRALAALGATLKNRVVSADHVAALFQATPVPLVQLSTAAVITATNPAAQKLFGPGMEGEPLLDVLHDLFVDEHDPRPTKAQLEAGLRRVLLDVEGNPAVTDLRLAPLPGRYGELQGWVLSAHDATTDVTARERAEQARAAAEAASAQRTRFLAMVSHELRTPLNGIIGMADFLQHPNAELRKKAVEVTRICAEQLSGLISEFLDFAQLSSGTTRLGSDVVDLNAILDQAARVVASRIPPEVAWQLDRSNMQWSLVNSDSTRLRQLLDILLENAIKYTSDGHIRLLVDTTRVDARVQCRFVIEDSGCGIHTADLPTVFEPYRRSNVRTEGHGLGLAIANQLVTLFDGTITIESTENVGTRAVVHLDLPAAIVEANASSADAAPSRTLRVLSVDDNAVNRMVARLHLEHLGCEVVDAVDGVDCIEKVQSTDNAFDLILMDCEMPRMSGPQASEALRQHGDTTPIVALTAHALPEQQRTCEASGMVGFLSKPLRAARLKALLSRLFPQPRAS